MPECFNAYLDGETVNLLTREGDVVRRTQHRAEHVTYARAGDMPPDFEQAVRSSRACRSMTTQAGWTRMSWRDQWVRRDIVRGTRDGKPSPFARRGIQLFEGDVDPVRRFITDHDVRIQKPRRCYLDIETDSRVPFTRREEARILSWSIVGEDAVALASKTKMPDPEDPTEWVNDPAAVERFLGQDDLPSERWGLLADDTDGAEADLVGRLWEALASYDQILVWGSPFGLSHEEVVVPARTQHLNLRVDPRRWVFCDHLRLFARMNQHTAESSDEKRSMKLDAITRAKLGAGKANFDSARTYEAWRVAPCSSGSCMQCRGCMLHYNRRDTRCLPGIESRTGFAALFDAVAESCRVVPDSRGLFPSRQMDGFMLRLGLENNYHFPTKRWSKRDEQDEDEEQYEGAYVMAPRARGVERDVHVGDFKSLYPSIILTWNMSPDTKVWRRVRSRDDSGCETETLEPMRLAAGEPIPPGMCWAPGTGQCFRTDVEGFLPMALRRILALRAEWSEKKAQCAPGTVAWVEADKRSTAFKVIANSFYGVVGSSNSRYYDVDVAESITLNGVWLIKATLAEAEQPGAVLSEASKITRPRATDDVSAPASYAMAPPAPQELAAWSARPRMTVIYTDTDSLFVKGSSESEFGAFVKWCNRELYPRIVAATGARCNEIKLAYEKQFARLVFTAGKRYVGYYVHREGKRAKPNSEPEIKGLEYKRGDTNILAMTMQKRCIDLLRDCDDPSVYREVVREYLSRVLFEELSPEECAVSQAIKKPLKDYKPREGSEDDLAHVQIAKILIARGREIGEGSRIEYIVTDGSASPMKVAPAEDMGKDGVEVDRYHLWEKKVYPPTMRLVEAAFPDVEWGKTSGFARVRPAPKTRSRALPGQAGLPFLDSIDVPAAVRPRQAPHVAVAPPPQPALAQVIQLFDRAPTEQLVVLSARVVIDGDECDPAVLGELLMLAGEHPGERRLELHVLAGGATAEVAVDGITVGDGFEGAAAELLAAERAAYHQWDNAVACPHWEVAWHAGR